MPIARALPPAASTFAPCPGAISSGPPAARRSVLPGAGRSALPLVLLLATLSLVPGCYGAEPPPPASIDQVATVEEADQPASPAAIADRSLMIQALGTTGAGGGESAKDIFGDVGASTGLHEALAGVTGAAVGNKGRPNSPPPGPEAPTVRAWFPESFLWVPILQTDAAGAATVSFTVPDTLTTWRLLALAQTREGSQGGATHTFLSTLPAYVDVAAPLKLRAGDVVDMPVQVVNQVGEPLRGALTVVVTGGSGQGGGAVSVPAWGSSAMTVRTVANRAGTLTVEAGLTGSSGAGAVEPIDSVRKSVTVTPVGRPVTQSRAGSLAGPRTVGFEPVPEALEGSVQVTVFPGALSVLRSEVDLAGGRGGDVGAAAYAWRVSQSAGPLVTSEEVKAETVRDLGLVALQRLMRVTRSANSAPSGVHVAALALAGLGQSEGDGLDAHLAARMRDLVLQGQQPDGLWSLGSGYGLDEQLIASARCLWALRQADGPDDDSAMAVKGATLRFSGALERFADRLTDPYVAAWALASGGADGLDSELKAKLRKTVDDALAGNPDGSLRLEPTLGPGSARVLGSSTGEATAVAVLALSYGHGAAPTDAEQVTRLADLATGVLGRWSPGAGFGGGWAGLTALPALAIAMGGEIPANVTIRLYADAGTGEAAVGEGALDPLQKHAPVHLTVPGKAQSLRVEATPAVPGLAFTAVSTSWVPWTAQTPHGLELRVTPPAAPRLGAREALQVEISGPTGVAVDVDIHLPAGVDPGDASALSAALAAANPSAGTATTEEGAIHLRGMTLQNGLWSASLPVTPTLSGTLQSGAAIVTLSDGETFAALPGTWVVRK